MTATGRLDRQADDLAPGTRIGRYRIEDPVGRGGMGVVYRAFDETTNRNVALKLLSKGIAPPLRERFLAECEAEANIRHEHIMPVYDRGWLTDEQPYFAMELLYEPITLAELLQHIHHGTLASTHSRLRAWNDLARLLGDVVLPICEGIHVANQEYGIQHRDLKPDNVLIDIRTRRAYLIDFGICRAMDDQRDVGRIVGTPRFLSPEQARGRVDARTDVWGLGALLYACVTGEPPLLGTSVFTRKEVQDRIEALKAAEAKAAAAGEGAQARGFSGRRAQLEAPALRVQEDLIRDAAEGRYTPLPTGTSPGLQAVIQKAMAVDASERYETAGALAADLKRWLAGGGVQALTEAGRGGAAVDLARRLLNRNVVRGAGALTALALGLLLGTGLFGKAPPQRDFRLADAATDARAMLELLGEVTATGSASDATREPLAGAFRHWQVVRRREALAARAAAADPATAQSGVASAWRDADERLAALLEPGRVVLEGIGAEAWSLEDVFRVAGSRVEVRGPEAPAVPGVYLLEAGEAQGVRVRVTVPAAARPPVVTVGLRDRRREIPLGMLWIPRGSDAPGAAASTHAPFLAMSEWVTNERYSEWLDELDASERAGAVPPAGFERDPRDPARWLVTPGAASRPVVGVAPRDAEAYAAWRTEVDGLALALPSAAQWRRMAAIDRLDDPGASLLFPWVGTLPWRQREQRGEGSPRSAATRRFRDESPYGIRKLYAGPGEIVRAKEGDGFAVAARGGVLPSVTGIRRTEPLAADARGHAHGFRLVHQPD